MATHFENTREHCLMQKLHNRDATPKGSKFLISINFEKLNSFCHTCANCKQHNGLFCFSRKHKVGETPTNGLTGGNPFTILF